MKRSAENMLSGTLVHFNVGGVKHRCQTTLATLRNSSTHFPDSVLAWLFQGDEWRTQLDADDTYFIDRSVEVFAPVLLLLRHPYIEYQLDLWESDAMALAELEFWGLLKPELAEKKKKNKPQIGNVTLELARLGAELRRTNEDIHVRTALAILQSLPPETRSAMIVPVQRVRARVVRHCGITRDV